jgi:xylulokinase
LNQCGWQSSDCQGSRTRDEAWASFNAELEKTTPGSAGLVYFSQTGVRQSSHSIRHGGFVGLRLNHSRADMGRAMLEGAAYELRWALERLRRAGMAIEQMWMVGGAAQSPFWPQIVADVTGVPIRLTQYTHGPALGAAILAGVGLGVFDSVEAGLASFRVSARQVKPGDAHAPVYDKQFAAYRRMTGVLAQ